MQYNKDIDKNVYELIKVFVANDVINTGTYLMTALDIDNDEILGFHDLKSNYSCAGYFHDSSAPGSVNITYFNTANYIISGTFEMTLKNPNCTDSIMVITDGRFDLKY